MNTNQTFKLPSRSKVQCFNPCSLLRLAVVLLMLPLAIDGWASATYKYQLKTVTQNNTGLGRVYASTSSTAPDDYSSYYANNTSAFDAVEASSGTYYLFAIPAQRGVVFNNWTTNSTSSNNCTAGSSTLTNATTMQGASVIITAPTNASGTSTYTTTATVTANWNQHTKAVITYAKPTDGKYRVTYEYSYLNTTTNKLETGFSFDMDESSAAHSEDSYNNDVITLQSLDGVFEGWYNGSTLLSTANSYTYVASADGSSATISAHYTHVDKYYGKLTASIAAVPYSMPGGGTIFIANDPDATGTYSDAAQQVSLTTYGVSQSYYLHAKPTDKRYVFRGWYSDATCTSLISTDADYAYTFTSSSTNSASPTLGNVYAAFDFNLYYMQVEVEPAVPGLGMVLVKDNNTGTPEYTDYTTHAEQFLYAYRLAPTANAYLYAKPKYGYKFSGWYDNPDCTGTAKSTANPYTYAATGTSTDPMNPTIIKLYAKFVEDASTVNITYNLPDQTKGEYTASVLDIAEVDDDFIWTFTQVFTSEGKTGNTTQAQHKTDVLRLEAQPKAGYGVTSWTIAGAAKTTPSQLYETTGTAAATYGVTFGDAKPFLVCAATDATTGTAYASLREALDNLGTNKKIVVVQNAYVPAGDYTIPSGVTLLVPYESTYKFTGATVTRTTTNANSNYMTLTIGRGANVTVANTGALEVGATQYCGSANTASANGKPATFGKIIMEESASITIQNGGKLYCWGYITGSGIVSAQNGSTVYECFQMTDYGGGTKTSNILDNDQKVFPVNQYFVQNIEVPITFAYGAKDLISSAVNVSYLGIQQANNVEWITTSSSSNGLFRLASGATVLRKYDGTTDRQIYSVNGNATIDNITISLSVSLKSANYRLPLTNNMTIHIESGTTTINPRIELAPDVEIYIHKDAKAIINSELIVDDVATWGNAAGSTAIRPHNYVPGRTYTSITASGRTAANLKDAKLHIEGELQVNTSNGLYTCGDGADICSTIENTGKITFSSAAASSNLTFYHETSTTTSANFVSAIATPAKLHNGDDSYTPTSGSVAGDVFLYTTQERWLKNPKVVSWNANGGTTEASTMAYSEGAFVGELPAAYKDGYTLEGWYTAADGGTQIAPSTKVTANVTYYAHWTPKSYSITYRDQGGVAFSGTHVDSPNAHPTMHTFGTATTLNSVNNKTGYTFGGWYRTPSCSGTVVTSIAASECKNITLYAKWIPNTHKLTWDWNGGATSSTTYTTAGDAVAYNTAIVYPEASTMTKTNYVFNGWDKSIATMPDEDLTITAQWEPAVASVTVSSTTTYYATFLDAFNYAKTQATATIALLSDIEETSTALTYDKASGNCTLDLNGHTVTLTITGAGTSEIKMFNINAASSTFTITDNSNDKDGKLVLKQGITTTTATKRWRGIYLTDGTLILNVGDVQVINDFTYASTSNSGIVSAIYVAAGKTFTMNGGSVYAESPYYPRAIEVGGSTSANATVTLNAGTITANATVVTNAMGIYTMGGTTTIKDGVTINATTKTKSAYGIYVESSKNGYAGKVEMSGGTVNSTSTTTTAYGVYVNMNATGKIPAEFTMTGGEINVTSVTHTAYGIYVHRAAVDAANIYRAIANISGGEINVTSTTTNSTTSSAVTDGVYSLGTTTITGDPVFNVTATTTYARGIRVLDGKTTISGTPTFTVRAKQYAYGAAVTGVAPTEAGVCSNAELEINNGTFDVATTSSTYAYGAHVSPVAPLATDDPDVFYKSPSKLTINDGQFTVKAQTTTAQGVNCSRGTLMAGTTPNVLKAENLGTAIINGGTFDVSTLGTTTAQGITNSGNTTVRNATFNVTPKTTTAYGARCYHGLLTIDDGTVFNVTATATAYGIVAGNEQPTTVGLLYDAEAVINGGTINVETTSKATIYGLWASRNSRTIATGTANEGNYASAGKITVNGGEINVTAKTNPAYAVVVDAVVTQSGNADYPAATATPQAFINGGKFFVTATSSKNYAVSATPLAENCQITGGYYNVNRTQTSGTTLAKYAVSPNKVLTLRSSHALYPDGYRYTVGEGGTVTWKNGTTTLLSEVYLKGETPAYTGETPTKAEDAQYTYTHDGWTPTITAMNNSDVTYSATFTSTIRAYAITFVDGDGNTLTNTPADNKWEYGTKPNYTGLTPTKAEDATNTYTFNGTWSDGTNTYATADLPNVTGDKTYTAQFTTNPKELGAYLDIVDWTSTNEVVLNMNGYTSATAKANWTIRANNTRYTKTQRDDKTVNAGDRTMKIDLTGMGLSADQKVVIEGLGTEDVVESYHSYTVPHIYNNSATLSGTNESSIVYVRNTATLTINANTTIKDIYVNPGAELKINEGATLTVTGKIVLRTEPFASAVLTNNGTLTIADGAQMYYSRKQADNSQIYQLALPYETDLSNAVLSNGKEPSVSVMEYNSADRAEYGKSGEDGNGNWQKITGTALQANKGYQLLTPSAYYYEVLFPIAYTKHDDGQTVSVTAYSGAAGETSKGWNYICSPYTAVFECNYTSPEQNITISQLSSDNKTFTQDVATTIKPAQPFYYQATAYGYLEFSQTNFVKKTKGRYASNSQETQWIRLRATNDTQSIENLEYIEDNSELSDIANLYINNKFSKDYELGYDVEKMSTTGSKPLIYTSLECGDLALAALPDSIAQEAIPVSLYMPQNGNVLLAIEYTDFMNRLSKLWLVDNLAGEKTDLLTDNYLLFAEQGTTKGRLFLQAEFIEETPEVTTDDNNIKNEGISIYNIGHTIVVENSAEDIFCFDATGKLVTHKKPDEKVMLNVPQNGMYLIQVGKETKKIVIE